jgi:hypothetical protein
MGINCAGVADELPTDLPNRRNGGSYWVDVGALTVNDKRVWMASCDCATAEYDHAVTADTMAEAPALL